MFVDKVTIQLRAGKGGNGIVAWHREKFLPKGGPSGGNGGQGGSIIFIADHDVYSLEYYRNRSIIKAEDGKSGEGAQRQGKRGSDLLLKVPLGTLLRDSESGTILYDFTKDKENFVVCEGGKGGKGNAFFKSSRNRTPQKATPGKEGEEKEIILELKLIADVGLVGLPNAGKSTFLSEVTEVPVKIAPYPFTTLRPNLGYMNLWYDKKILFADIPGIIKGASVDKGLGLEFLRHIERTKMLVFILDAAGSEGRSPWEDYKILCEEIRAYNPTLLEKPFFIALNKVDIQGSEFWIKDFRKRYRKNKENLFCISSKTGEGISSLISQLKIAFDNDGVFK